MAKKTRRTKTQKFKAAEKKEIGFKLKQEWLNGPKVTEKEKVPQEMGGSKYFRQDLTKTFVLTMLVLALELALWNYLSRR